MGLNEPQGRHANCWVFASGLLDDTIEASVFQSPAKGVVATRFVPQGSAY